MTIQRQERAQISWLVSMPVLIPNTATTLYAISWISLVTRSCVLNLLPNVCSHWTLNIQGEVEANKSTVRPYTFENQDFHYSTATCRPVHDTIALTVIVWRKNTVHACLAELIQGQINLSNGKYTCVQQFTLTHILFLQDVLWEKQSDEPHSASGGKWALGVDRALCGDYMRQKRRDFLLFYLPMRITGVRAPKFTQKQHSHDPTFDVRHVRWGKIRRENQDKPPCASVNCWLVYLKLSNSYL